MGRKENLWSKEMWTQSEVSKYFRVAQGTVKNWRENGLLSYWQAPGSSKILFFRDDIKEFLIRNVYKKNDNKKIMTETKKVRPSISSDRKKWEI